MPTSLQAMRAELDAAMSASTPGISAADALCSTCVGLFGVDGAAVSLVFDGTSSGTFGSSSEASRRLDEYQFTYGEGPCLDAVSSRQAVLVPDLDARQEQRWPIFRGALLEDGIRGVFAVPILVTSVCVGALDLFRARPGPLEGDALSGAFLAAGLASAPLVDLMAGANDVHGLDGASEAGAGEREDPLADMDRVEVYQATGMLISALDLDAAESLLRLRAHAIATGQTASQVARAIIERRLTLDRDDRDDRKNPGEAGGAGGARDD